MNHTPVSELDATFVEGLLRNAPPQEELSGIHIVEADPGYVHFDLDIPSSVLNYHGSIHGGFISTLCEIAAGMATYSYGVSNVALAAATNFIKAAGQGKVSVFAETIHRGRSTSVIRCRVVHGSGKLLAEATYTMFILRPLSETPNL